MEKIQIDQKHICYEEFNSLVIILASISIAFNYKKNGRAEFYPGNYITIEGKASNKSIRMPIYGPVESALIETKPDLIEIIILDLQQPEIEYKYISSLQTTLDYLAIPYFVRFYENNIFKANNKFGTKDYTSWPESWRFGWVIRNALVHNNCIFYENINTPPVTWKIMQISPSLQGVKINTLINFTDIVLLMLDMSDDLN